MTTVGAHVGALSGLRDATVATSRHWLISTVTQRAVLVGVDIAMISAAAGFAFAGATALRARSGADPVLFVSPTNLVVGGIWMLALFAFGSYAVRHLRAGVVEYKRVITSSVAAAGSLGLVGFLSEYEYPRDVFVLWFGIGCTLLLVSRFVRRRTMQRLHLRGHLVTPVLVAGGDHYVDSVASVLRREKWLGYRVVGAVTREHLTETATGLPVLGSLEDVVEVIADHGIHTVIFAEGSFPTPADFRRLAWRLEEQDIQMMVAPSITDVSSQRLDVRPLAGLPLIDVDRPHAIDAARWIKRGFDLVGAAVLLLLVSPALLLTAIAIRREDRGPVVFRQRRVGLKGAEFDCLKFRSMCVDAEDRLSDLQDQNEAAGVLFKMTNDPRITRVGRIIRRYSIDELPQLWNVLRGDMSLVGPRPALPSEVALYDSDTTRRLDVRPGLTGLWQVSGRSNLSWDDTVRLDLYYVDNWSMVQDLMILAKTAKAVVGSDGAY